VVFAFETLVHCSDKEKVYREVFRVMKPGGRMIVYDYALKDRYETYDDYMKMAISLISKGGASALIESLEEMNAHYVNCGLEIEKCVDFTKEILPDLKHLERKATKILKRPWLAKLMFGLLPDQGVTNIILGYLGYNLGNADVGTYREWVLRKP
jgi:sterol 24-C-methyltransferase